MAEEQQTDAPEEVSSLIGCITQYDREFMRWRDRVKKIIQKYRGGHPTGTDGGSIVRFNILWSNVQTLVPATFAKMPRPDVSRRFRDNDPVGRVAALILQRALEYEVGQYSDYMTTMRQDVLDRFLGGRGTCWVRYEPHMKAAKEQVPTDGVQITEDVDKPQEELDYECAPVDYVHWEDFGHSVARTWEEVTLVWRVVYMNEDSATERFGEETAKALSYDASPKQKDDARGGEKAPKQARIYEIWDKTKKRALWLSKAGNKILDERPDPLGLVDFWPCPKPLYATITNDTLIPVPDYKLYEEQARALDTLQDRIDGLVKALQVKGVYDSAVPELARLFTEGGNTDLVPVKNFAAFAEKNGLKGALDLVDLTAFYEALKACYLAMSQIKEYIYEITGISDIVRGESNANETLGAQQIKQNFVGLRLKDMQGSVARFASEALAIKGQIICGKYSPQTISSIAAVEQLSEPDKQFIQPALALLIGPERLQWYATGGQGEMPESPNPTRQFRIDIEADSLTQIDEQQDKQDRVEFLTAIGTYMEKVVAAIAQVPPQAAAIIVPSLMDLLKFGVIGFKVGRPIEGQMDQMSEQLKQLAQSMGQQQAPPDPEAMREQITQEVEQQATMKHAKDEIGLAKRAADLDIRELKFNAEQEILKTTRAADEKVKAADDKARAADTDATAKIAQVGLEKDSELLSQQQKHVEERDGKFDEGMGKLAEALGKLGEMVGELQENQKDFQQQLNEIRDEGRNRPVPVSIKRVPGGRRVRMSDDSERDIQVEEAA